MTKIWETVDYPVKSHASFQKFQQEFEIRRQRALARPLTPGDSLTILNTTNHAFLPEETYCTTKAGVAVASDRQCNLGVPRRKLEWPVPAIGRSLTLRSPLSSGLGRLAQVWLVRTSEGHAVVVKIFISCLGLTPYWSKHQNEVEDFFPEEELAHRECWAYGKLKHLQGTGIPYSYGFYDVCLSCVHMFVLTLCSGFAALQ
jgi:hypothetical protein